MIGVLPSKLWHDIFGLNTCVCHNKIPVRLRASHRKHRLVGWVVKASASRVNDSGFESCLRHENFLKVESHQWLKNGHSSGWGTWRSRVSTKTGQPSVSRLWLGEVESLICNFYLNVAACKLVWTDPSLTYTSMLLGLADMFVWVMIMELV